MIKDFISVEDIRQSTFNEVVNMIKEIGHLKSKSIISMGSYFSQEYEDKKLENLIVSEYKSKYFKYYHILEGMTDPSRSVALHEKQIAIKKAVGKVKIKKNGEILRF